jgi:hypothetical protein
LALPDPVRENDDDETLPHVVVKQKAILPINVTEVNRPVAMETGFTVPYSSMMQIRKQVRRIEILIKTKTKMLSADLNFISGLFLA